MRKSIILTILLSFVCIFGATAREMNSSEKALQNQVKNYLAREGFSPYVDSDGDLAFKKEGTLYWYTIQQNNDGTYFITINHEDLGTTDANKYDVLRAINQVSGEYRAVKCYLWNDKVKVRIEFYAATSSDITKYFYRHMSILNDANSDCKKYYTEYSNE